MIEVCVINLGNGRTIYGEVENISDLANLEKQVNPLGYNDTEVQLIDSDINISDRDLLGFLRLKEEHRINECELVALFQVATYSEIKEILEYDYFYTFIDACNKESAFQTYYEDMGYAEIPEHLENYINWDRLIRDFECDGLCIENVGTTGKPFIDSWLFVRRW